VSGRHDRQREELEGLERALKVFDDPETATRPGMQLMRDAVAGKRDKMAAKLRQEQEARLEVVVGGVPAAGGTLDPVVLSVLLETLRAAVVEAVERVAGDADPAPAPAAVATATALRVAGWAAGGPGVVLAGPPADVRAAVRTGDGGAPLLDAALAALVDDPGPLARFAAESGATLRLTLHLPFEDEREAAVGAA
jgi:hypothetical protein